MDALIFILMLFSGAFIFFESVILSLQAIRIFLMRRKMQKIYYSIPFRDGFFFSDKYTIDMLDDIYVSDFNDTHEIEEILEKIKRSDNFEN
jgi:hypothetical protein